jgi:hypothetical protein
MKRVLLIFPDVVSLSGFVMHKKPGNVEVNSQELSLSGYLTDSEIECACSKYAAFLKFVYEAV